MSTKDNPVCVLWFVSRSLAGVDVFSPTDWLRGTEPEVRQSIDRVQTKVRPCKATVLLSVLELGQREVRLKSFRVGDQKFTTLRPKPKLRRVYASMNWSFLNLPGKRGVHIFSTADELVVSFLEFRCSETAVNHDLSGKRGVRPRTWIPLGFQTTKPSGESGCPTSMKLWYPKISGSQHRPLSSIIWSRGVFRRWLCCSLDRRAHLSDDPGKPGTFWRITRKNCEP